MEMSYGGTLVMPKSYAVMDQEEMCYVEGGASWSRAFGKYKVTVSDVRAAFVAALGVAAAVCTIAASIKGLVGPFSAFAAATIISSFAVGMYSAGELKKHITIKKVK